jgi:DNA repair exonuclease SbcCD ATPase subunit
LLTIKNITIRNFMSVGNVTQAVKLDQDELTLVLGNNVDLGGDGSRNGTGKTTLINALSYGLYGKALTNIKQNNLINKTNGKGMMVTVDFTYNGNDYRIERGRSPNVFHFLRDGMELGDNDVENAGQGEMRMTQFEVENVIGLSHSMFKHIVALNTYTEPFLSLKAGDQRELIEELLGITELSRKAEALKEISKNTKEQIREEEYTLKAAEDTNARILKSIKDIERRQKVWTNKQQTDLETLETELSSLSHLDIESELKNHELLVTYNENLSAQNQATSWINSIEADNTKQSKLIERLEKEITLIEEHKCHACGQEIHDDKQEEILTNKNTQKDEAVEHLSGNKSSLDEYNTVMETIGDIGNKPKTFYDTLSDAYQHQNSVEKLQEAIESNKKTEDPYADQIADMRDSALEDVDYGHMNTLKSLLDHQDFLLKLLTNKDSFIRKKIIDQNLSYLNSRLAHYLDKLGLPHDVIFQSDLSVEITELGRDLDFDNLSRGERNRLILGLSWSFRDIFESLYSTINVLFVDELIDSGMDTNGVESSLAILKKMARDGNRSVYLISHKDELQGRVESVLNVIKENGFTSFSHEEESAMYKT